MRCACSIGHAANTEEPREAPPMDYLQLMFYAVLAVALVSIAVTAWELLRPR
jgi:hypothetical protein